MGCGGKEAFSPIKLPQTQLSQEGSAAHLAPRRATQGGGTDAAWASPQVPSSLHKALGSGCLVLVEKT